MKIVYCADKAIYKHLPTTLNSLLKNNSKLEKIYLLVEDDAIDYICHPKIEFINLNRFDFVIRKGFNCTKKFPYMAMARCYFTKILNEDKVIYYAEAQLFGSTIKVLKLPYVHISGSRSYEPCIQRKD